LFVLKVHYSAYKSPPLAPIFSQISPVHTTQACLFLRFILLFTHLFLSLPSGHFLLACPPIFYKYSSSPFMLHVLSMSPSST
jgi:hypothetical protein